MGFAPAATNNSAISYVHSAATSPSGVSPIFLLHGRLHLPRPIAGISQPQSVRPLQQNVVAKGKTIVECINIISIVLLLPACHSQGPINAGDAEPHQQGLTARRRPFATGFVTIPDTTIKDKHMLNYREGKERNPAG